MKLKSVAEMRGMMWDGEYELCGYLNRVPLSDQLIKNVIELGSVFHWDYIRKRINETNYPVKEEHIMALLNHKVRTMLGECWLLDAIGHNKKYRKMYNDNFRKMKSINFLTEGENES